MRAPRERFAALQSQGARDYQEDDFGILDGRGSSIGEDEHTLLVVADGMGGHAAGSIASSLVTETFIDSYQRSRGQITERLLRALQESNQAIDAAIRHDRTVDGMGTTLLACVVSPTGLHWISVGDSPLYLFRQGKLRQLNEDHSMAPILAAMVETGELTAEQAAVDPKRNALRSAVMGDTIDLVDATAFPLRLEAGDTLLLASDGMQTLTDEQIGDVIETREGTGSEQLVALLMRAVLDVGKRNQDNATVLAYAIDVTTQP